MLCNFGIPMYGKQQSAQHNEWQSKPLIECMLDTFGNGRVRMIRDIGWQAELVEGHAGEVDDLGAA